jgi:TonB family protein
VLISGIVRARLAILTGLLLLDGCATALLRPATPAGAPAEPERPSPFDEDPASFLVTGGRFPAGETAIVKVCVTPEGLIGSAQIMSSSGDKRFDDYALLWARQVRLRSLPAGQTSEALCGPVRVEIRPAPVPEGLPGRQSALS